MEIGRFDKKIKQIVILFNLLFDKKRVIFAVNDVIMDILKCGVLSLTALSVASCVDRQSMADKPNVVLIYADDLGYGDLECYGAKNVRTPNVDGLASNGLRFTNAHAVAATSTPSRYSLLTGEYAWRKQGTDVAAGNAAMIISPEQYTLADVFKDAGYRTAAFGKWHLGLGAETGKQDWNGEISPALADIGFDYSYIMAATADRVPCVFIENGRVANYDASSPIEVSYTQNFAGEPTGRDNPELLYNQKHSHGHDMSIVNGIGRIGYMKGGGSALWKDENIADSITVRAVDFISNSNEPFFIYFATNDVHVPRFPHERFRGLTGMGMRGDAIAQFDWCVGQVVEALRKKGIFDNTIIIVSSDNGPVLDDGYDDGAEVLCNGHDPMGGLRGGKYSSFEAGTRVPFIVHWPEGIKNGGEKSGLVSQVDFVGVMAEFLGIELPEGAASDTEGSSADYWLGEEGAPRSFVAQLASNHTISVRSNGWKYIEPKDAPQMVPWGPKIETGASLQPQLYRIPDYELSEGGADTSLVAPDFFERNNLAGEYPLVVKEMSELVEKLKADYTKTP